MNCATPTDFTFSFQGFCRRGGDTDIHSDGWGVGMFFIGCLDYLSWFPLNSLTIILSLYLAFYQGEGLRQFHDTEAASTSRLADFLGNLPIRTLNMMGHIRYATVGNVNLANVHPFSREMWGIEWCFAHNGEVPMFDKEPTRKLTALSAEIVDAKCTDESYYNPVGSTDSEATFCAILNALRQRFNKLPSLPVLYEAIQKLCDEIVQEEPDLTIFNFMLTAGPHTLWVYSWPGSRPGSKVWNGLHYTTREYPFTTCHLRDIDYALDFSTCTTKDDRVSVIATQPLTDDEQWTEISRGELILFDQGRPRITPADLFQVELDGHGLHSNVLEPPVLEDDMKIYNVDPSTFQGSCI
jgi:glutamine amidotransferase